MTERRYYNQEFPLNAMTFNHSFLGIFEPGRYRGYDTIANAGGVGINIDVLHSLTGIQKTKQDNSQTIASGICLTKHGVVIEHEGKLENIAIDDNVGAGSIRVDLLIIEHTPAAIAGGQVSTISVIKGTPGSGAPALTNPERQIILGEISIAANGPDFASLTWAPADVPNIANKADFDPTSIELAIADNDSDILTINNNITLLSRGYVMYTVGANGSGDPSEFAIGISAATAIFSGAGTHLAAMYGKNQIGDIKILGGVTGISSSAQNLFRLPAGYRPTANQNHIILVQGMDSAGSPIQNHIHIKDDGWVASYGLARKLDGGLAAAPYSYYIDTVIHTIHAIDPVGMGV